MTAVVLALLGASDAAGRYFLAPVYYADAGPGHSRSYPLRNSGCWATRTTCRHSTNVRPYSSMAMSHACCCSCWPSVSCWHARAPG